MKACGALPRPHPPILGIHNIHSTCRDAPHTYLRVRRWISSGTVPFLMVRVSLRFLFSALCLSSGAPLAMEPLDHHNLTSLDVNQPFWDRVYLVSPLVIVGTKDETGALDLAPKHMAFPMGWRNYFGFVCTPRHKTYHNAKHTGVFTVSYPRPSQVVLTSLAAAPRTEQPDGPSTKPSLDQLPTFPAEIVDGVLLEDAYFHLECEVDRIVDDLGENSLLIGTVAAAHAHEDALRVSDTDAQETVHNHPLLAYLPPDRYTVVNDSNAFPFPAGFSK
jgi:flavin reductase (DIM6/NTAB) family NADH-FMN oxidoreductase RutF